MNDTHKLPTPVTRREMLQQCACGFGGMALSSLLGTQVAHASSSNPLSPKQPNFAPKAKRVIFIFMHGGPSHIDLFDYKKELIRLDDQPLPIKKPRVQFNGTGNILKPQWSFKQHGQSGAWVSELFPEIASVVDDLCFVKSLHGTNPAHGGAILKLNTGTDTFVRPSMGSWISYGLGTENQNLPSYLTICPSYQHGGVRNYSSAFLPASHHGTPIGTVRQKTSDASIDFLDNPNISNTQQRKQLDLIQSLNQNHLNDAGQDSALEGRIKSLELAFRMQTEVPDIMSIDGESQATKNLYGLDDPLTQDFGLRCLLARRFSEQGVRFVQATHGDDYKWDHHGDLHNGLERSTKEVDKPVAGLIKDLKSRGLLDETLVLWGGEFGRTPGTEGGARDGRGHPPHGVSMFMAGAGVKPGMSYGLTDDFGYYAVSDKVHIHDLHATMMHILGLDHTQLTYHHDGRDFRLTDVHGTVVHPILS